MEIQDIYKLIGHNTQVVIDSRKVTMGCIFFALKGDRWDGNVFALNALDNGAAFVVVDDEAVIKNNKFILVPDVLKCLQELAVFKRKKHFHTVIGLTGSNGKTTTKELCRDVLRKNYKVHATVGNYNNDIGLPLTILQAPLDTEILLLEMGANHQGEIDALCHMGQPNLGIITNIGKAHLEGFGGIEGVKKGKSELYRYVLKAEGAVFVNSDDKVLMGLVPKNLKVLAYRAQQDFKVVDAHPTMSIKYQSKLIKTQLYGDFNVPNIACAMAVGAYFKIELDVCIDAIQSYVPENNRSQKIVRGSTTIIMDAYNANPTSMQVSIANFSKMEGKKIAILGDMLELGQSTFDEHLAILNLIEHTDLEKAIFVGPSFMEFKDRFKYHFFINIDEAQDFLSKIQLDNTTLLLKGSRGMTIEKILNIF